MSDIQTRRGACGVLVERGRVLLGRRSTLARSNHGQWDVIGGHIEQGESEEQAMLRELHEELGVIPTSHRRVVVLSEHYNGVNYQIHVYSISKWSGEPTNCSNEHDEIRWFSPSEITKLDLTSESLVSVLSEIAVDSELPQSR